MATTMSVLDRILTMEIVRVTERAAVAAAKLRGKGDKIAADQVAVDAMRTELNNLDIDGVVVIGEGEMDEAPMLYIGEHVGTKNGPLVDIALDPLEGTTICAKDQANSLTVIAIAERGNLLNAPDIYMDKIAVGPGYSKGVIDLDKSPTENVISVAREKGVDPSNITACLLDRPRHKYIMDELRALGAGIRLISDGDVAGVINVTNPDETGIDLYFGSGGAPEGVLSAAALACLGGQMQGRLLFEDEAQRERAVKMGIANPDKKFELEDMAKGDVIFAATGVTSGEFLKGVKFNKNTIETDTIVTRSSTGTIRRVHAIHRSFDKFKI